MNVDKKNYLTSHQISIYISASKGRKTDNDHYVYLSTHTNLLKKRFAI